MAIVTEDYVSFETALLLNKKGFEQVGCQKQYNTLGYLCVGYCYGTVAPTLQMAMKWLREVYEIDIIIFRHIRGKRTTFYDRIEQRTHLEYQSKCNSYYSYEEAAEAAIKYCLRNLI